MRYSHRSSIEVRLARHTSMRTAVLIILLFLFLFPLSAQTQLYENVVKIKSIFSGQKPEDGFGFVIHESEDSLYIVTAFHVLAVEGSRDVAEKILISFYEKLGSSSADIVEENTVVDLALLKIAKPNGYGWDWSVQAGSAKAGDKVWIIGYNEMWLRQSQQAEGTVVKVVNGEIETEFGVARHGCSGGPLIKDDRIAGMVTEYDGARITALSIGTILRMSYEWLNITGTLDAARQLIPVEPAYDLPFIAAGFGIGFNAPFKFASGSYEIPPLCFHYFAEYMPVKQFSVGVIGGRDRLATSAQWEDQNREFQNQIRRFGVLFKYYGYFLTNSVYYGILTASHLDCNPQIKFDNGPWIDPLNQQGKAIFDSKTSYLFELGFGGAIKGSILELGVEGVFGYSTNPLNLDLQHLNNEAASGHWLFRIDLYVGLIIRNVAPQTKVLRY